METHELTQGTPEWHAHRSKYYNASEAPAMMAASPWQSRDDLLFEKKTGIAREVSADLQRVFDRGHAVEAPARAIAEEYLGEDLYPASVSNEIDGMPLGASLDGITLDDDVIFEHKQWNQKVAAMLNADKRGIASAKKLEPKHYWQIEQQLLVTGASRCIWVMSDGTRNNWIQIEYLPVRGRAKKLIDGWKRFIEDLEAYTPPATENLQQVKAYEPAPLPALEIRVDSALQESNFDAFAERATQFLDGINTTLETDQDFADAEANVKACKAAEGEISAAVDRVLASSDKVNQLLHLVNQLKDRLSTTRLSLDKSVKSEKQRRKQEIISAAQAALDTYNGDLNESLHGYRVDIDGAFAEAAHGLKTLTSIQSKVNDALAVSKVEADRIHALVKGNWEAIPAGFAHLFTDWGQIAEKDPDDFLNLVNVRIKEESERQAAAVEAKQAREAVKSPQSDENVGLGKGDTPETLKTQPVASLGEVLTFDHWWNIAGSGIIPAPGEDQEEHCRRVARIAWRAAQGDPF